MNLALQRLYVVQAPHSVEVSQRTPFKSEIDRCAAWRAVRLSQPLLVRLRANGTPLKGVVDPKFISFKFY